MSAVNQPNPVFLASNGGLTRQPDRPDLARAGDFWEGFDRFGLFYDVFRDANGKRVWFVGPDPKNLLDDLVNCRVEGIQSGHIGQLKLVKSHENIAGYLELPEVDHQFALTIAGQRIVGDIGANHCERFQGKRVLLTMNQDNDLQWIEDWVKFYVKEHGADSVCIFDNNSSIYDPEDLSAYLTNIEGISSVQVVEWPFIYGVIDKVGQDHGLNPNVSFAQPPMFPAFHLRFGLRAASILNVDIDELILSSSGKSIFAAAERRYFGTLKFDRFLVENVQGNVGDEQASVFQGFHFRNKDRLGRQDHLRKWVVAPGKLRRTKPTPMPWTHRVYGILNPYPASKDFKCYHFASVNTGWRAKTQKGEKREWQHERLVAEPFDPEKHLKDEFLAKKLEEIFGQKNG
ncbi:hypothetical protein [Maritalea myrionectae]|uniref:hypothetical protein n=1 Tax=Maritalea myrionectae TaxID=454601 RepID=UPI00040FB10F|nr:hypothetical protein [Maritalea myrionectae]